MTKNVFAETDAQHIANEINAAVFEMLMEHAFSLCNIEDVSAINIRPLVMGALAGTVTFAVRNDPGAVDEVMDAMIDCLRRVAPQVKMALVIEAAGADPNKVNLA
jgi:hypothetical protein